MRWHRRILLRAPAAFELWRRENVSGSNGVPNVDDSLPPGGQTLRQALESQRSAAPKTLGEQLEVSWFADETQISQFNM